MYTYACVSQMFGKLVYEYSSYMMSFVYYLDVFICLYFLSIAESYDIYIYIYIYLILFAYKIPMFTFSVTKCLKKRNGLLRVAVIVNVS
jgi:hypothetical protein